jgi:TM2 domain-containing membrane protein YozV
VSFAPANKNFVAAWLFSLFFGTFGVDRFYLGKPISGLVKFLTLGGFGLWALYDLLSILTGSTANLVESELNGFKKHALTAWIVTVAVWVLTLVFWFLIGLSLIAGFAAAESIFGF